MPEPFRTSSRLAPFLLSQRATMNPFTRTLGLSLVVIVCLFGSFLPDDCHAQNYPDRPIRIVNGFAAGGGADLLLRAIQPKVIELLGQQVIVDYKTGTGGN